MIRRLPSPQHLFFFYYSRHTLFRHRKRRGVGLRAAGVSYHACNPTIPCVAHSFLFVCLHADNAGKLNTTPSQIFKMSSRSNATVFSVARGEDWVINLPPQNVSTSGVGLFSQVSANFSPQVQSSVLFTSEESAKSVGGGGSVAAFLETGKQMFPRQPRGVTSAYGLKPRCLHDTGARSADCGPK